jgi:hypothetical protein
MRAQLPDAAGTKKPAEKEADARMSVRKIFRAERREASTFLSPERRVEGAINLAPTF